jgi:hypothetical protein
MLPDDNGDNKIQHQIRQLLEEEELSDFHPLFEKLQQWSSTEIYSPDFFEFLLRFIKQIKADAQQGRSIENVIEEVRKGKYIQPEWDVNNVYQTQGHVIQFIFSNFHNPAPKQQKQSTKVPVVLLVMNTTEAQELASGDIFKDYSDELGNNFSILKRNLDFNPNTMWMSRYHDTRELWQPFNGNQSIQELIIRSLKSVQKSYEGVSFNPSFKDIQTVNKDRCLLQELRNDVCIVIIDVISLCHPKLFRAFQQSLLDAYQNTFVLVVAPTQPIFPLMRQMTMSIQLDLADMEFAKRRVDHDEEFSACKETCDENECQQWLRDRLEKTVKTHKGIQRFINKFHKSEGESM